MPGPKSRLYESVYFHDEKQHSKLKILLGKLDISLSAVLKQLLPTMIESLELTLEGRTSIDKFYITRFVTEGGHGGKEETKTK